MGTYTYATLEVPARVYQLIRAKMEEGGSDVGGEGEPLDMHGIALTPKGPRPSRTELEEDGRRLADAIVEGLPPGSGFTLLVFDFGESGNLSYISNAQRPDMLAVFQEMVRRLGGN